MEQMYTPTTPLPAPVAPPSAPAKANGFGIAALLIAVVTALMVGLLVVLSTVLVALGVGATSPWMVLTGLLLFACIGADALAAGLGVVGLLQAGKGKLAASIGLALSGATMLGLLLLIVVGNISA